jgi:hypothetical protein
MPLLQVGRCAVPYVEYQVHIGHKSETDTTKQRLEGVPGLG